MFWYLMTTSPCIFCFSAIAYCRQIDYNVVRKGSFTRTTFSSKNCMVCIGWTTLQRQFRLYFPFLGIARPQPQFPRSCVFERFIYSRISPHISSSRTGRPIVGIYNSLTDTWMWKLGLKPRYSFSGVICFQFFGIALCSVEWSKGSSK